MVKKTAWAIVVLLVFSPPLLGATRVEERPAKEMLRVMDLLREWDLIKDLDLMRQMDALDREKTNPAGPGSQRDPRARAKDGQK